MNWIDEQVAREHAHDIQRDAERQALVSVAERSGPARAHFYAPWLAGLGRRLVTLGIVLEERYTPLPEPIGESCGALR